MRIGNLALEKSTRKNPCDWLPDQGWEDVVKLAELFPEQFGSLPDDIENNTSDWKSVSDHSTETETSGRTSLNSLFLCFSQWYDLDALEQALFPMKYEENLSAFQKMLLLRCFRVDRVFRAVADYVSVTMGEK